MDLPNGLKTAGYVISSLSVLLLGMVSWRTAERDPVMTICLVAGMAASVVGMILRWSSYQLDKGK